MEVFNPFLVSTNFKTSQKQQEKTDSIPNKHVTYTSIDQYISLNMDEAKEKSLWVNIKPERKANYCDK